MQKPYTWRKKSIRQYQNNIVRNILLTVLVLESAVIGTQQSDLIQLKETYEINWKEEGDKEENSQRFGMRLDLQQWELELYHMEESLLDTH